MAGGGTIARALTESRHRSVLLALVFRVFGLNLLLLLRACARCLFKTILRQHAQQ